MNQESGQSISKSPPLKLKLKDTSSTKPIVEEKPITKEKPLHYKTADGSRTYRKVAAATPTGVIIMEYKNGEVTYDLSKRGNIYASVVLSDIPKLDVAIRKYIHFSENKG